MGNIDSDFHFHSLSISHYSISLVPWLSPPNGKERGWRTSTLQATWPWYYTGRSYVRRLPCIKGHFYVQGINFMYHRSLYYKGQSYVLSFQSNQSGMYRSHAHIHMNKPFDVCSCIALLYKTATPGATLKTVSGLAKNEFSYHPKISTLTTFTFWSPLECSCCISVYLQH